MWKVIKEWMVFFLSCKYWALWGLPASLLALFAVIEIGRFVPTYTSIDHF